MVSFHFVASIKNAKGKKNPKNGVEFECEYFLTRLRFCAKRQIDDKKNHFKISRDSFLLRKKEFQPLVSSEEPQRHLVEYPDLEDTRNMARNARRLEQVSNATY